MSIEVLSVRLLQLGAVIAALLIAAGVILRLLGHSTELVTAGLIVLLFTPILRVVVALCLFLQQRDFLFALFSVLVLLALAAGIWIGRAH